MLTKEQIHVQIKKELEEKGLSTAGEDFERPWGGFFKISNESLNLFLEIYFSGIELPFDITKLNVSPKILVVEPGKKLSWQSHERRSELWRIVKGPAGIFTSQTDEQPEEMEVYNEDDIIEMELGTRHRLVGMDDWGIVAEIWVHRFPENPSDEDDIRRISDDFGR
ncbi:MAG TPA: phosphoheptose isomerase [Ignavibacteria bacterium]|nr:phosphoheptose isomerase [Ignavibacteria bacterium]HMR40923.1 phosphoheptose isomerase [Ignavibacteria bacterium]